MKEMIKLNKKGFTLVELLVVLVILVVIMAIAIPSVTSSLERSKQNQKNSKIELMESAAEIYIDKYKNSITSNSVVTTKDLICEGLLTKEQAKDPTNEKYTICGYYSYRDKKWVEICTGNDNYRLEINSNLTC